MQIRTPIYIKKTRYNSPKFLFLAEDQERLEKVGKILDSVDHKLPLSAINVTNFAMYYYNIYKDIWFKFYADPEEVRLKKIPKYFKYVNLGDNKYALLGGFDVEANATSNRLFIFQEGHFTREDNMISPRQYFGIALNENYVYAIAGYNSEEGIISKCERLYIQSRKWEAIESINVGRINTAAIKITENYVYCFGGQSAEGFLNSIERYNVDLNVWSLLEVSLPDLITNATALQISSNHIMLLGGLKCVTRVTVEGEKETEETLPEIDKNAYFFDMVKQEIVVRVFCQFRKKLQSAQINGKGYIYCLYMNNNRELPHLFIADLNNVYPEYSPYSAMLKLGYLKKPVKKIQIPKQEVRVDGESTCNVELMELKKD